MSSVQTPAVIDLSPGPGFSPRDLEGAAGQWEPTLAALPLRHSLGTDGASLGWDPGQGRVPATEQPADLRCGSGPRGWGAGGSFCAADPCWLQGHPSGGGRGEEGSDKWVSENGWLCHPRGPASSSGPPGQLQDLCSMCVGRAAC